MVLPEFVGALGDNPYFSAGFGLFGVGAGAAVLRKLSQSAFIMFRRHYVMTLEVPCRDKSYHWLLRWIAVKGARNTQHLSVSTKFQEADSGKVMTKYEFIPSIGVHFFK
jgi:chaperone BCS1